MTLQSGPHKPPRTRRSSGVARHEKVAISVPQPLLEAAREKVETGEAPSLSAVFSDALAHDLDREDAFEQLVEQMIREGELTITDEDRAWARQVLAR
jgi:Arc/MetJ-type ribon-helix-helix transcriptional regulator